MYLRVPIEKQTNHPLRVLIYARYSTEEQDASSIDDQFTYVQEFVESTGVNQVKFERLSDEEMSGEIISRPGINMVREGIKSRRWDVIIAEDSSRIFRNVAPCLQLVGSAVDNGIRCIFINDNTDTAETEHWEEQLTDALNHHARSNRFTSQRIRRKHEGLWKQGAAIGLLKPGYTRRPTVLATMGEPEKGPFFDSVDERTTPIIIEAFERIYQGDPPWSVADFLTLKGLPKCGNARTEAWTAKNVIELIRRPDYRGHQVFRATTSGKHFGSGKRKQRRNEDSSKILERDMPHLRIVSDCLWYGANASIDKRCNGKDRKHGIDHPLAGIPRDSRGPLSLIFFCGRCGGKMWMDGRNQGGYRCSNSNRKKKKSCWNKASALRELTHQKISKAIVDRLLNSAELVDALLTYVDQVVRKDHGIEKQLSSARVELQRKERACNNLEAAIEDLAVDDQEGRKQLSMRYGECVREKNQLRAQVEQLESAAKDQDIDVSREQLEEILHTVSGKLLDMDRESGTLLHRLVPRIEAVPCQQFGSNKVVLRACFQLNLVALLPDQLIGLLEGRQNSNCEAEHQSLDMCVDLFEPSNSPKYGLMAFALKSKSQGKMTLEQIGRELGISKRSAHLAVKFGEAMHEAGITDPYIELTDPPAEASRWR